MDLYRKKLQKIFNKIDKLATKGKDNALEYHKYVDELVSKGDYAALEQVLYYSYGLDIVDYQSVDDVKRKTWETILFQTTTPFLKKLSLLYKNRGVYQSSHDIYTTDPDVLQINISNPLSATYSTTGNTQSISLEVEEDIINIDIFNTNIYSIQIFRSVWVNNVPTENELIQNINVGTQSVIQTQIPITHVREYLIKTYERPSFMELNYKVDLTKDAFLGQIMEVDSYTEDVNYLIKNNQYARIIGESRTFLEVHKNGIITEITTENPSLSFDQNLLNRYSSALDILLS